MSHTTVAIAGSTTSKPRMILQLQKAGVDLSDQSNGAHGHVIAPGESWVTCLCPDGLGEVEAVLTMQGDWSLRAHWNTGKCPVCNGLGKISGPQDGTPCPTCKASGRANRKRQNEPKGLHV